jgi:hypothetical protein
VPAPGAGPGADVDGEAAEVPVTACMARSLASLRSSASRFAFSFSVGIAALCLAATYGPESAEEPSPVAPSLPTISQSPPTALVEPPGPSGKRISSAAAGDIKPAAAASAWISPSVIASSFLTLGIHSLLRSSMTSLQRNLTRESRDSLSASACSLVKYPPIISFGILGLLSRSLPTVDMRPVSASMFSSGGVDPGAPSRSVTHACRIFSAIIFFLKSSPMSRMLPIVRSLTRFVAAARSAGSVIVDSSVLAWPAPSNSSWQVFNRMRLNVIGLPSEDSPGNSGSSLDRRRQTSAYMPQKPGSQMALSNTMEIVSDSAAAVVMPTSSSCSISRSNFSGVILLRMDLTARVTLEPSSSRRRRGSTRWPP